MEGRSAVTPKLPILFEDNHVLVVQKPAGMLSQKDLSGDLDVLTAAGQFIKERDKKPGNVYLGLVHRLDRPVGGVMVVAKTSKAAARLSAQFRERTTEKIYRAVVEGRVDDAFGELCHRLEKNKATRITRVVTGSQGKEARLSYRVVDRAPDRTLVEIKLITGLSHQIRAQLAAIGHPILGDKKYGSTSAYSPGAVALFAVSITFLHPVTKQPVHASAALPADWPYPA